MNNVMKERNNPYTTRYEESTGSIKHEAQKSQALANERRYSQNESRINRRQGALAIGLAIAALTLPNLLGGSEGKPSDKVPSGENVGKTK